MLYKIIKLMFAIYIWLLLKNNTVYGVQVQKNIVILINLQGIPQDYLYR